MLWCLREVYSEQFEACSGFPVTGPEARPTDPEAPPTDPQEGCVNPGDEGNDLGIGRYCTAGGGECEPTSPFVQALCLADLAELAPDLQQELTYCSVMCEDDDDCGVEADGTTTASCVQAGVFSICVPYVCQDWSGCVDDDGDGYCFYADDCDDTDHQVNPSAEEVCGDGIDNDCDGYLDEGWGCP